MGTTFHFLEQPQETSAALKWFRALPQPPEEILNGRTVILYFRQFGTLAYTESGNVDFHKSPVVTLIPAAVKRNILWTVGEAHFLPTPLRKTFHELHKISLAFQKWLFGFECVSTNKIGGISEWNYYLEGSVTNFASVFALPDGFAALAAGQYFVADDDNDFRLDTICAMLRLRGVQSHEKI